MSVGRDSIVESNPREIAMMRLPGSLRWIFQEHPMVGLPQRVRRTLRLVGRFSRHWSAVVSLLAFQVTPVQVVKNANGQLEIAVGFGAEHYVQQSFDCDGNPVTERPVQTHIVSGIVDYRSAGTLHISAFGGHTDANLGVCTTTNTYNSYPSCYLEPPFAGGFGGAIIAREGRRFGIGGGLVVLPMDPYGDGGAYPGAAKKSAVQPALQLRIGNRERVQMLLDINTIRAPGEVPMSTLGVGFGRTGDVTQRGFLGVGLMPYVDVGQDGPVALVGRAALPMSRSFDVIIGGYAGAGDLAGGHIGARWRMPLGR
jgi:hypothetical protein